LATDPRDHVYSLLGLVKSTDGSQVSTIVPDYGKTVAWAFPNASKMFVEIEATLEFLNFRCSHLPQPWLPSWVPDFTSSGESGISYPSNASGPRHKWEAAGALRRTDNDSYPCISGLDASILLVKGAIIDRVVAVVDIGFPTPAALYRIRQAVLLHESRSGQGPLEPPLGDYTELDDTLWRTLISDRSRMGGISCPTEYCSYYKEVLERRNDAESPPQELNPFQKAILRAAQHWPEYPCRRLLLLETLGLGLGPPDCDNGDMLCLIAGYSMPVVLRPCEDFFRFVGNVYVRGIMYGEKLSDHEVSMEFIIK